MFVGRRAELAQLLHALHDAAAGRGRLALVRGEAGIGKTGLAMELAERGSTEVVPFWWGRCTDSDGAPPFWPWAQVLAAAGPVPAQLAAIGGDDDPAGDDPAARFRLFEAMTTHLAASGPAVVVLDDLQWADPSSLRLLAHLASVLPSLPLLVLATSRDISGVGNDALSETLAVLARVPALVRIDVEGLEVDDVATLASAVRGSVVDTVTASALTARTGGNPFFVRELARTMDAGDDGTGEAPASLRDVLRQRVAAVGGDAGPVLEVAALLGRTFDVGVVAAVVGDDVDEVLVRAAAQALVVEDRRQFGIWSFVHDLVRETLHDDIGVSRRTGLHAEIARAIEVVHADDPAWLSVLAHHWLSAAPAGHAAEAIAALDVAAANALKHHATDDAADLYGQAVELTDRPGQREPARRYRLLVAAGTASFGAGRLDRATERLITAAELARDELDDVRFAEALLLVGAERMRGDGYEAPRHLLEDAARRVAGARPDLYARLLGRLADRYDLPAGTAAEQALNAVDVARESGDVEAGRACIGRVIAVLPFATEQGTRARLVAELEELTRRSTRPSAPIDMAALRFRWNLELGEVEAAERLLPSLLRQWREADMPGDLLFEVVQPIFPMIRGEFDTAEELSRQVLALGTGAVAAALMTVHMLQVATVRTMRGRADDLLPMIEAFAGMGVDEKGDVRTARAVLALIHADAGRFDDAARVADLFTSAELASWPVEAFGYGAQVITNLVEAAALCGDPERMQRLEPHLGPLAGTAIVLGFPPLVCLGAGDLSLGMAAATLGRADEAAAHYDRALAMHQRMQAAPHIARTEYWMAHLAAVEGDHARAADLASAAGTTARRLGMDTLHRRASMLVAEGPATSAPERAGLDPARPILGKRGQDGVRRMRLR